MGKGKAIDESFYSSLGWVGNKGGYPSPLKGCPVKGQGVRDDIKASHISYDMPLSPLGIKKKGL